MLQAPLLVSQINENPEFKKNGTSKMLSGRTIAVEMLNGHRFTHFEVRYQK